METTFTITVDEADDTPVTWRAVSTDDAGTVVEDFTYTLPAEEVAGFANVLLGLGLAVAVRSVETDNLATSAELAAVEASFPTEGTFVTEGGTPAPFGSRSPYGEDRELRDRLTADGIAHGNY